MPAHVVHNPFRRESEAASPETSSPLPPMPALQPRHMHRERDFGIGYGNSSGYGCEEHYARPWGPERFRCV